MMMKRQSMISSSTLAIQELGLSKKVNWLLVAAVACTFANGLVISLWVFPAVSGPVGLENFGDGWAQIGENIVKGYGFVYDPTMASTFMTGHLKREPVYSLFLALILALFDKLDPYMFLFQALINSLTCFLLYFIVSKSFNRQTALLACFLYAFYPFTSWYVPRIAYETLLGFFVAALVLGLVNLFERLSYRRALFVGLLIGITVLCRGIYLLFPFALLLGLVARFRGRNKLVIGCWLTAVVAMLIVLSPWVVRNYSSSREFVPATTQGGISYFIGNKVVEYYSLHANTAGYRPEEEGDRLYNEIRDSVSSQNPSLSNAQVEVQADKRLVRMAIEDITAQPLTFIKKILKGVVLVWFVGDTGLKSTALLLMQAPVLFLGIIGIFYSLRTKKPVMPLMTVLLYSVLIQTALSPYGRYSYPMVPILIAFAAYFLDSFGRKYFPATTS